MHQAGSGQRCSVSECVCGAAGDVLAGEGAGRRADAAGAAEGARHGRREPHRAVERPRPEDTQHEGVHRGKHRVSGAVQIQTSRPADPGEHPNQRPPAREQRALALSGGAPVRFRADHGPIPKTDASADDGKERDGYQTCAQPSPGSCQGGSKPVGADL